MNDFNHDNEIIEIANDSNEEQHIEEKPVSIEKVKNKKTLKEKWHNLDKKNRVFIILSIVLILLLLAGLIVYLVFHKSEEENKEIPEDPIVIEKDNYKYIDGKLVFLDKSDREIGSYECVNKSDESCSVKKIDYSTDKFERITNVDENGQELDKNSQIYFDALVFIQDGEKLFLYNFKNNETVLKVKDVKISNT